MFDLNQAIAGWRDKLAAAGTLHGSDLNELEAHLRDEIEQLTTSGLSYEEAFWVAANRLGNTKGLSDEFAKVNPGAVWSHRVFWMATGLLLYLILKPLITVVSGFCVWIGALSGLQASSLGWLNLAATVTSVTATLFVIYRVATRGAFSLGSWFRTGKRRTLFFVGAVALVSILGVFGRILILFLIGKLMGAQEYGQMALVSYYSTTFWSVLLPAVLAFLIIRLHPSRQHHYQA